MRLNKRQIYSRVAVKVNGGVQSDWRPVNGEGRAD